MSVRKPKNLEPKAADLIRDLYKNYKYYKRRFGTKDPVFYMVASKIIEEIGELAKYNPKYMPEGFDATKLYAVRNLIAHEFTQPSTAKAVWELINGGLAKEMKHFY